MAVFMRNGAAFGGGGGGDTTEYMTQAEYEQITPVQDQLYGVSGENPINAIVVNDASNNTYQAWSGSKVNAQLGLKANSADVPTKAQITNPNLLDNPWFTINQRGQTQYTGAGYTVDRWKLLTTATVSVTDNGLNISSSSDLYFIQYLENDTSTRLLGKTITMSALVDGVIYKTTAQIPSSFPTSESNITFVNIGALTLALQINATRIFVMLWRSGTLNNIRAVKLELGSISTLALDTAPNYATELLKCQRYFIRLNGTANASMIAGYSLTANGARFPLAMPTQMRVFPTLTYASLTDWGASKNTAANAITPTSMSISSRLNHILILEMIKMGAFTAETHYQLCSLGAGVYLDFTADL